MKNYYKILELDTKASKEEITKAYFKLTERFPSYRYKSEFMLIREAYEILSDQSIREQYDEIISNSSSMKEDFETAQEQIESGELALAIKKLEKMESFTSCSVLIKFILGKAYLKNDNNGKAFKVFSELSKVQPQNAAFEGYLAEACLNRGWHKKAIVAYENALKLDRDNISLWTGLADVHIENGDYSKSKEVYENLLANAKEIHENTIIHYELIMMNIYFQMFSQILIYVDNLIRSALSNNKTKDNIAWMLLRISSFLIGIERTGEAKEILDKVSSISSDNKEIAEKIEQIERFYKYEADYSLLKEDKKVKNEVAAIIAFEILPKDTINLADEDIDFDMRITAVENEVIQRYEIYKASIVRLKKGLPRLYNLKREFFERVTNSAQRRLLQAEYAEKLDSYIEDTEVEDYEEVSDEEVFEEVFEEESEDIGTEDEQQEPAVKEKKKIGRNDPCPCGSGKKYKKCCGRNI